MSVVEGSFTVGLLWVFPPAAVVVGQAAAAASFAVIEFRQDVESAG